jgi:hypothetical protein
LGLFFFGSDLVFTSNTTVGAVDVGFLWSRFNALGVWGSRSSPVAGLHFGGSLCFGRVRILCAGVLRVV